MPFVKAFYCILLIKCERADRNPYFQRGTLLISTTGTFRCRSVRKTHGGLLTTIDVKRTITDFLTNFIKQQQITKTILTTRIFSNICTHSNESLLSCIFQTLDIRAIVSMLSRRETTGLVGPNKALRVCVVQSECVHYQ